MSYINFSIVKTYVVIHMYDFYAHWVLFKIIFKIVFINAFIYSRCERIRITGLT